MRFEVRYVEETGSTNDDLSRLARSGAPVGTVLWAGHQTAGRGRLGRTWEAPPHSSLLVSVLLAAEPAPFVATARVALAAADACRELTGVEAALKWPNDLMVGDRKLAGLLAETQVGSSTLVVGVGCNVAWPPPAERPAELGGAVALSDLVGQPPDSATLLDRMLSRLQGWLVAQPHEVLAAYRTRCSTLGRLVRVDVGGRSIEGRAAGIAVSGALRVTSAEGTEAVHAGDVVHVRTR